MTNTHAEVIEVQRKKVNAAYATTGAVNPEYEREFEILSSLRAVAQADEFRLQRGLPADAKTPYD